MLTGINSQDFTGGVDLLSEIEGGDAMARGDIKNVDPGTKIQMLK